ncbi:MAG: 2-hydroxychromene-2-carboxylate isomerase [Robiginitomaculum sp.]|nr:MAG: 2-hydroxychromene-2-carboxylate isomerase [Robiginitomaculum sp.]
MAQCLAALQDRYGIEIKPHLVGPPPDWAVPDRERLVAYARQDVVRLAVKSGLHFADSGDEIPEAHLRTAQSGLADLFEGAIEGETFWNHVVKIGDTYWQNNVLEPVSEHSERTKILIAAGNVRREKLGHYLGGMVYYGGEWYWGIDRLHHLEDWLRELELARTDAPQGFIYEQPALDLNHNVTFESQAFKTRPRIHFYVSFRSPYSYIVAEKAKALADHYGAELVLRFVLPMVMRGLPVPKEKRFYILADATREARRLRVSFGKIADPLGKPVERGYALLPWARAQGRDFEFSLAFMKAVWSEGVDAGADKGLRLIVESADLNWAEAKLQLNNEDWRAEAEANRVEMLELGIWGVPSFRLGNVCTWGQDRLWVIEDELKRLASEQA